MMESLEESTLPLGDHDTPINPHVMLEIKNLNHRINLQNDTMRSMWKRWEKIFEREKWLREAYPEIVAQHEAIEDLKRASRTETPPEMTAFSSATPKASGQAVKYEVGNGDI